jgi:hypothetical protein
MASVAGSVGTTMLYACGGLTFFFTLAVVFAFVVGPMLKSSGKTLTWVRTQSNRLLTHACGRCHRRAHAV